MAMRFPDLKQCRFKFVLHAFSFSVLNMPLIHTLIHPSLSSVSGRGLERKAVRAIALHGDEILLLYTRRYNDYSFPGGGINADEDLLAGLRRELKEEAGADNVRVLRHYGDFDEYRPHNKPGHDFLYMRSHFYVCQVDRILGESAMETYEISNGMAAAWINIHEAIAHNEKVMADKEVSMGMSIHRETLMLKHVARNLLATGAGGSLTPV
jgi:ADP-ribose pyrophosphatase YjhB (NUDIX family)